MMMCRDLEPQQLVLFIQSFGIPVESMSKLLQTLDQVSALGPGQCCGAGAALFGRSRSREKGGGSSSTAQAPAMSLCLKKIYNKNVNNNVN